MSSTVIKRDRLEVKDDPKFLSPPLIDEPLYQCGTAVTVRGYVLDAKIELEVDGASVAIVSGGASWPDGVTIPIPNPLVVSQKVRARQKTATARAIGPQL